MVVVLNIIDNYSIWNIHFIFFSIFFYGFIGVHKVAFFLYYVFEGVRKPSLAFRLHHISYFLYHL